jgi:hypothetical protein
MRIVPPIRPIRDGKILDVNLINHIIQRTEYGAELLSRYKMVAGSNIFVEQAGNGLGVSYLTALAGGAGTGSGGAGTGSGGAGTGTGGAGTGNGGGGTPQPATTGDMYIGIAASTGAATAQLAVSNLLVNNVRAIIGDILGTASPQTSDPFFLTRNLQGQVGAIWSLNKVSSSSFTASFNYGIAGASQADGFTLIFSPVTFLGGSGGGLGYQGGPTNSVAVEIDIFQNSPFDPNNSHIAVLKNADVTTHLAIASPSVRPQGTLSVTYSNKILNIFLNGIQIISYEIDIPAIIGQ